MVVAGKVIVLVDADLKKFRKGMNQAKKGMLDFKRIAETAIGFGVANAAMVATRAVKNFVISSTLAAIDAREIFSKFEVVFESIGEKANEIAKELKENYGLANVTAKELLGTTGDLLVGFGFTEEAALDMAYEVQKLSVDLASFTNIEGGAERASRILTRGLIGERETLKMLGISILEADVKTRLLEKGQSELTGTALKQARAQATLDIALQQSGKAAGDYARTSGEAANQLRLLGEAWKDFKVIFGESIVPIITPIIQSLTELLKLYEKYFNWVQKIKEERYRGEMRQELLEKYSRAQFEKGEEWAGIKAQFGVIPEEVETAINKIIENQMEATEKQVDSQNKLTNSTDNLTSATDRMADRLDQFGSKGTSYAEFAQSKQQSIKEGIVYERSTTY